MRYTFNLKNPKSESETLILFSTYFRKENKKFVYSTGETILPSEWDFKLRQPNNTTGRSVIAENHRTIKQQMDRCSSYFVEIVGRYKNINEDLNRKIVREHFDKHFKKTSPKSNRFFDVYELFLASKTDNRSSDSNTTSTISRYKYNKKLLEQFQQETKVSLNLNNLNIDFYNSFLNFCIVKKKHSANTLRRNVGLLKTYLNWSLENNFTHNSEFQKFKSPSAFSTDEVALTMEDVKMLYELDLSKNKRLERVRDLFIFGCATGMRYGNYSKVKKSDVENGYISVIDNKDKSKALKIPLNSFSVAILEKYDFNLPVISGQKFNKYIKEVFIDAGYTHQIKKTTKVGNEITEDTGCFSDRISSHTARRSFITIMKNKKIPDKVIMGFTGHRSLEVFNKYYKPNEEDKKDFMTSVWN